MFQMDVSIHYTVRREGLAAVGVEMGAREIKLFKDQIICPDGTTKPSTGPYRFTQTRQSHSPVAFDPYKPQIQIQLFFLPLKLLKSKVKGGGEMKFSQSLNG